MIITSYPNNSAEQNRIIVILGIGLIGSAIHNSLTRCLKSDSTFFQIDWSGNEKKFEQTIFNAIQTIKDANITQIDWVWSAGKSGFSSNVEETKNEYQLFRIFIETIFNGKVNSLPNVSNIFHLVSSAGGLFEGQTFITKDSVPSPKRPYGELKLEQEKLVINYFPENNRIYRLSSAFGNIKQNQRIGLISVLIKNAIAGRITAIQGNFDTKRDYVWVNDIASFIVNRIIFDNLTKDAIYFLVSGKPSTIYEIIDSIKKITNQKVLFKLEFSKINSEQIVFSPCLLPLNWNPTSIQTCIRQVYQNSLSYN